jgi:signal peptidase I
MASVVHHGQNPAGPIGLAVAVALTYAIPPRRAAAGTIAPTVALVGFFGGLALLARATVVETFRIPAGSMIPTLAVGDHLLVEKWAYRDHGPRRGEVIVFRYPKDPSKDFAKRVIGVGGDTVEVRNGAIYLNGQAVARRSLEEPCQYLDEGTTHACRAFEETLGQLRYRTVYDVGERERTLPAARIPDGALFVMGDNRDNSHDSRFWGTLPVDHVKGRALAVWGGDGAGLRPVHVHDFR